ncbi:hypothetical protein E4U43_003104 [Claviceps pusilla]|uniref:Uncharacterized protein n=1 Tax=Claviceps pusilla TaxID=123648 RepID=A0A9P7SUT0_9HYPO|nr:hypothetical protein E4U43_003104 [Claviceps pusilla]
MERELPQLAEDREEKHMCTLVKNTAAAAAASAAAVERRLNFKMWCTDPENTGGFCEDQGLTARCCTATQWGLFMYEEQIALAVKKIKCEHGNGHLYCTLG